MSTTIRPTSSPSTSRPSVVSGDTHTVVKGDTLSAIAARHGVSLETLKALNPQLKGDFDVIQPGDVVHLKGKVPGTTTSTPASTTAKKTGFDGGDRFESPSSALSKKVTGGSTTKPTTTTTPAGETMKAGNLAMHQRAGATPKLSTTDQVAGFGKGFVDAGVETAQGLWTMAKGTASIFGFRGGEKHTEAIATVKNIGQTLSTKEGWKALGSAVAEPFTSAWKEGRYGEAVGRGTFEAMGLLVGMKGLDKLGKGGKAAAVASKADDAATIAAKVEATNLARIEKLAGNKLDDVAMVTPKSVPSVKPLSRAEEAFGTPTKSLKPPVNDAREMIGSATGRFKPESANEAAYAEALLKKGTDDANSLRGANGRYKPENADEARRVAELKATFSHQANSKAFVGADDPNRLIGGSGRFKPESDAELLKIQDILNKGTDDLARYRGPDGVWKAETPEELSRVLELKAVTSHLDNGGARFMAVRNDPTDLLGASGRFKVESDADMARISTLLRKGTDDANSLRGANGVYKPENPAEAMRVAELRAVFSHQANSTVLTGPNDARRFIGASGRFKPESDLDMAEISRIMRKGTDDVAQYRTPDGVWKAQTPEQLARVNELKALLSHLASGGTR